MGPHDAVITGIFDQYIINMLYCSPGYLQTLFGPEYTENSFFLRTNGADPEEIRNRLSEIEGVLSMERADRKRELFDAFSDFLDILIVILTIMSGLMAYFILFNLANTYMAKKKRELTIMRVNGFSTKECIRYASLEVYVTTGLGVILGLIVGRVMGNNFVLELEQEYTQYIRTPDIRAFVFSAGIAIVFAVVINWFVLRKIKNLKLSDVA